MDLVRATLVGMVLYVRTPGARTTVSVSLDMKEPSVRPIPTSVPATHAATEARAQTESMDMPARAQVRTRETIVKKRHSLVEEF